MEIDLIDNVPCSHCEQLVPCEHNPETSSKNFPPQTFNPSSSFCPSLRKMKKGNAREEKSQNPLLSSTSRTGRNGKYRLGSRIRKKGRWVKRGTKNTESMSKWDCDIEKEDWPKRLSYPGPENPLLISVSNMKFWLCEYFTSTIKPYLRDLPGEVAFGPSILPWGWFVA